MRKNRFNSIIALIVCWVLLIQLLPNNQVKAALYYDRGIALEYAQDHWNDGSGLCAEFVSRCINAGGCPYFSASCYNASNSLYRQLSNGEYGEFYELTTNSDGSINYVAGVTEPGDLVFMLCSKVGDDCPVPHVVIIGGQINGKLACYSHNNARNANNIYKYPNCGYCKGEVKKVHVFHFENAGNSTVNQSPVGYVDSVEGGEGAIHIAGWAFDPDDPNKSLDIHVYIGAPAIYGECHVINTNEYRDDVNAAYGITGNHGFDAWIKTDKRDSQPVYAYAINNREGDNPCLKKSVGNAEYTKVNITSTYKVRPAETYLSYSRADAVKYAAVHWNDSPQYSGDAANFVSACINAGGCSCYSASCYNADNSLYKLLDTREYGEFYLLPCANGMVEYKENITEPGDLIFMVCSQNGDDCPVPYVAMIGGQINGKLTCYSHTLARNANQVFSYANCSYCGGMIDRVAIFHFVNGGEISKPTATPTTTPKPTATPTTTPKPTATPMTTPKPTTTPTVTPKPTVTPTTTPSPTTAPIPINNDIPDWNYWDDEEKPDDDNLYEEADLIGTQFTYKGIIYIITGETEVKVNGIFDTKTTITIPQYVKYDGCKYEVVNIGNAAFKGNKTITKVTINADLYGIGQNAFSGCMSLKTVYINGYVESIGKKAFYKCTSLKKMVIKSEWIDSIGAKAFSSISKKAVIQVPGEKYKEYKKMIRKAGLPTKATIKKT